MKIALAQIKPQKGMLSENMEKHIRFIHHAIEKNCDAIFFPELSLSSYEPGLAKSLAANPNNSIFQEIKYISDTEEILIGLGMPYKSDTGIHISMFVYQPNQAPQVYSKQRLHEDELPYFNPGDKQILIQLKNKQIAPAICYESLQESHAAKAILMGAEIYLASVAKPQSGIEKALKHFPSIAKKYSTTVLLVNAIGYCDNFESAGNTAIWNKHGVLIGKLSSDEEALLIYDTEKTSCYHSEKLK